MSGKNDEDLLTTMKHVASVLKRAEIPFALAGSFAVYARGGFSSDHDVDFLIREQDAEKVLELFQEEGFRAERPPEDWLVKVYDGDRLVDLIYRPVERPVTDETLTEGTSPLSVHAVTMPVLNATELMIHKLLSFSQHYCDFTRGLPVARSLREQIDWPRVRKETLQSPYATAFLVLLELMEVITPQLGFEGITNDTVGSEL